MSMNRGRYTICALAVAGAFIATPAFARQAAPAAPGDVKAAFVKDLGNLSDKFSGLARVMAGKYDWRPAPGSPEARLYSDFLRPRDWLGE
jgi:hypothetical protein